MSRRVDEATLQRAKAHPSTLSGAGIVALVDDVHDREVELSEQRAEIARLKAELDTAMRHKDEITDERDECLNLAGKMRRERDALKAELATAREKALEEAAQVADVFDCNADDGRAGDIAATIRVLAAKGR